MDPHTDSLKQSSERVIAAGTSNDLQFLPQSVKLTRQHNCQGSHDHQLLASATRQQDNKTESQGTTHFNLLTHTLKNIHLLYGSK